jgi:hypothetical protein
VRSGDDLEAGHVRLLCGTPDRDDDALIEVDIRLYAARAHKT